MATADLKRVIARNTAWNYGGFALNLATNLVMFPFVVGRLGDESAGIWLLLSSVTGYMGLLEVGIVPSLTQTIAASRARDDRAAVISASSTAMATLCTLALVALALLPAVGPLVRMLAIPETLRPQAVLAFTIGMIGFALRMPLATFQAVLLGHQRQDRCNQLWIVLGVTKLLLAFVILTRGYGLTGLVAMEATVHLLAGILQIRWVWDEDPLFRLSWQAVNRADVRRLLSFGGAILAVSVCSLIIEQTDRIVIALFLPVAMVTYYGAAWKIYMLSFTLTTTLMQAIAPVAAELHGRGDRRSMTELFLLSTKYSAIVAWALVFTLGMAGGSLLSLWLGERFVGALPTVQVLLMGFAVTAHNHAGYSALIGMRRVGPTVSRYFAPQAVLNLLLSIWLVRRLGIVGVALGTLIPALVLQLPYLAFVLKELNVSWREFFDRAVRPAAVPAFVAYLPLAFAYWRLPPDSIVLLVTAAGCSLVYVALAWRFLDEAERGTVRRHALALVARRRDQAPGQEAVVAVSDRRA